MNKNMLWIIVLVVVLVLGGVYVVNQQSKRAEQTKMEQEKATMKDKEDAAMKEKEAMAKKDEEAMMKKETEIAGMAMTDASSKKATLVDVSGGKSTGKGYVLRKAGKLYHTATANVPDPAEGSFYEGWLAVKGATPPQFVSSGKLKKQQDGSYQVSYSSDNLYQGYDFVVITVEKVDDQQPEKHIVEGLAQ